MIIPNNEMLTGITKKIRLMEEGAADHIVASSYPYNIPDSNPDPNKIRIASDPYSGISNFTENRFKEDRMLSLIELYEKTPYTPNVKVPVLKESDNGDEALLKMLPFIPMEYRHLLVWKSNVKEMLFRPKHGKNKTDNKILMLAIGRISTADDLQDPISAINHMIELVDMHEFDHDFCVMAICLDFYKKGEKTFGRLIYDEVFRQLWARDGEGLELIPNAIGAPEISRISRRMSVIFDVAEHCHFFDLKLMEGNDRTNLALPENAGVLAEKAAEAQIEVTRLGTRISKFKRGTMKRFRAIPGIKTFAFDVKSEVDDKGRTVNAWWVKKSMEFSILQYLIDQVLLAPNLGYLKKQVKEKFDYEISEDTIRKVLLDEKIVGLLRRPYKRRVLNPQTEKYHYRDCPLPADLENDFRQIDRPPFQVFAPDIVMTDPETYIKIRERLIDEKAARQQPTPHCRQKGHRPKGENGDHVLSGVLKCAVGQCRETYALAGPSGTDLMACQGRTKGRGVNRCAQHHYLHASVFILLIIQMIKGFFRELFPEFCSIYREEARARVDKLKNERDAFHDCLLKQQQHIQDVVKGVDRFGNTTKAKLDALLEPEFEKVKRFERLIDERGSAIRLVEENLSLENETVEARLSCLETIFLENPRIANEALRAIIDRIDIQSVQRDEYFDMSGKKKAGALHIAGALFLKSQTLFSMFKSTPALGNFIMPSISTKVDRTIVPTTSVEGHILMNFEVFISIQPS